MITDANALKHTIEAIIFASEKPISAPEIVAALRGAAEAAKENPDVIALGGVQENEVFDAVDALSVEYSESGRSFVVRETAAGWQLVTSAAFGPWLRQLYPESKPPRMSAPALETLAIIAYRQPVTRGDIEAVRGVSVDGVMQTLLDRNLVRIAGRADIPGRPLLYETTHFFMEHFGLRDLDELPNAGELRRAAEVVAEHHAAKSAAAAAPTEPETQASGEEVVQQPDQTTLDNPSMAEDDTALPEKSEDQDGLS
jgi:segregation and condensation protein B